MRNQKVRKRLAAGKLKLRIRDLRNLGMRCEAFLAVIGIYTADQLRARGAVEAFLALRRANVPTSTNLLWGLVGALDPWPEGTDWREIAASEQRLPLLLAVETREQARQSVLEASGARSGVRSGDKPPGAAPSSPVAPKDPLAGWAPGLPFEPETPKR